MRLPRLAGALLVSALALSACGGGSSSSTSSSVSTTTTTRAAPPQPHRAHTAHTAHTALRLDVRAGQGAYAPSVTVKPGDDLVLRAVVAKTKSHAPQTVTLTVPGGSARKLTITGVTAAGRAAVTLQSSTGSPVSLLRVRYACALPPLPTFCPGRFTPAGGGGTTLQFTTGHTAPVFISAVVGPVAVPTSHVVAPGHATAAPYRVSELVRAAVVGTTATGKPVPAVAVRSGEKIALYSEVHGRVGGAAQPVTVTVHTGPGASLRVTAGVPGGPTSTATITGAGGNAVTLQKLHYTCTIAPTPTFCPATHAAQVPGGVSVTFPAAPHSAVIVITGLVA